MVVLFEDERGQYLLARVMSATRHGVELLFPTGQTMQAAIDRLHELPRHESTSRRKGRW